MYYDEPDEFGALPRPIIAQVPDVADPHPLHSRFDCVLCSYVGLSLLDPRTLVLDATA